MDLIFFKLKEAQKSGIDCFCELKKFQKKIVDLMFCKLKKLQKHEFIFLQLKNSSKHEFKDINLIFAS